MFLILLLAFSGTEDIKITRKKLDNGLRVLFIEDHTLPVFAGIVQFDVGSAYERPGITGTSHLLEHMLFKGSKRMGTTNFKKEKPVLEELHKLHRKLKNANREERKKINQKIKELEKKQDRYVISAEIWRIFSREGGTWMNASTGNTSTQYFVMLPSNKKEVWAKVESDRFQNPVLREFYSERDVVNEERRMYESRPWSVIWDNLTSHSYLASPVRWSVIGWPDDIMNVTPEEVMDYYHKYYTPDRCVIALAGDVNPEKDYQMVKKYFGKWKKREKPVIRLTEEPEQKGMRRAHVNFRSSPMLMIGFHGPEYGEKDYYATELLAAALSTGKSSILKKSLMNNKIASDIDVYVDDWDKKAKSLIAFMGSPMKNVDLNTMENKIFNVIDSLKEKGISEKDLRRAKNNFRMNLLRRRRHLLWFTFSILNGERVMGDPEYYRKELEIVDSIDIQHVNRVLKELLSESRATVVTMRRDEQ